MKINTWLWSLDRRFFAEMEKNENNLKIMKEKFSQDFSLDGYKDGVMSPPRN